ncbi:MAG: DUF4254 domain-containing protein [Desulfovibrio sp.]|jgi:hypothetical protein|nr:DUF4254 domain-containing protein [Desulfovibrio sp.]
MKDLQTVKALLTASFAAQTEAVRVWHAQGHPPAGAGGADSLPAAILEQHAWNFQLWHVEDRARRRDVEDAVIAACKREIDGLNQMRNNGMEDVDRLLFSLLAPLLPPDAEERINTETPGMAVDRLSVLALKVYHMEEQTLRRDAAPDHLAACGEKLALLRRQRASLERAVLELLDDYAAGGKRPVIYSQCKMYNDPNLNPEMYGHAQQ